MLVDTGAQISLINKNSITNPSLINKNNTISISSIHGSEKTLGNLKTTINQGNLKIPIELHVTKNSSFQEDGILGYDIIGKRAIIDGPNKTITMSSGTSAVQIPINPFKHKKINNIIINNPDEEISTLLGIEYIREAEHDTGQYESNLQLVKTITRTIDSSKIKITPIEHVQKKH